MRAQIWSSSGHGVKDTPIGPVLTKFINSQNSATLVFSLRLYLDGTRPDLRTRWRCGQNGRELLGEGRLVKNKNISTQLAFSLGETEWPRGHGLSPTRGHNSAAGRPAQEKRRRLRLPDAPIRRGDLRRPVIRVDRFHGFHDAHAQRAEGEIVRPLKIDAPPHKRALCGTRNRRRAPRAAAHRRLPHCHGRAAVQHPAPSPCPYETPKRRHGSIGEERECIATTPS
ncbi:hypothetical protein FGB62_60g112 [Gracilaria domingensis]|nr:hypothetical protein FGB62_60g112 [Gracilaria domingensis]